MYKLRLKELLERFLAEEKRRYKIQCCKANLWLKLSNDYYLSKNTLTPENKVYLNKGLMKKSLQVVPFHAISLQKVKE